MSSVAAGVGALGRVRNAIVFGILLASCAWAPAAFGVEFAEGRVQIHGFAEMQLRALDEKFREELDLAQWYNVLNIEVELDIAPDGIGPFDLVSAYIRGEGRYDAIYSNGFLLFPSLDTYGDKARRLPKRLRDAKDKEYGGTIRAADRFGQFEHARIEDEKPAPFVPGGERLGFPGNDTFFRLAGPDNVIGPRPNTDEICMLATCPAGMTTAESGQGILREGALFEDDADATFGRTTQAVFAANRGVVQLLQDSDDPARYINERILDYRFAYKETRGPANTDTSIMGPWLPRNFVRAQALLQDRGNPFRGRVAAGKIRTFPFPLSGPWDDPAALRRYGTIRNGVFVGEDLSFLSAGETAEIDVLDPLLADILGAPNTVLANISGVVLNTTFPDEFGGDFMGGVVPCADPTNKDSTVEIRQGKIPPPGSARCIRGSTDTATEMTGGVGENPFRPAPDLSNLGSIIVDDTGAVVGQGPDNADLTQAQGIFIPSKGNQLALASGRLDSLEFNFDEEHRAFNRGHSQQNTKELKEAYLDVELLDSRLWLRLGLQNIVWGKTELFRTTDQFNPQDLALASLPSLEESRIALWSARFVYSLYDVGPLEDVRLEFATNLDQYQPSDLGGCGEPFTPDIVCSLTTGLLAHSILGVGVSGIDRPESPWKEPSDLEIGGRIEWRWDRFSFALTDFYGFHDTPYVDSIFYYERAVDSTTGRPLVARLPGQALGSCGSFAGDIAESNPDFATAKPVYSTSFASHSHSVSLGGLSRNAANPAFFSARGGIGRGVDCLRPGGAPDGPNGFSFQEDEDDIANTNALENHHANQQLFAWICANTVGIAATLDAGACAFTVFSSGALLSEQFLRVPFGELVTSVLAGEQTGANGGTMQFLTLVLNSQKSTSGDVTAPLASLNRLPNPADAPIFDRNGDNAIDDTGCADPDPAVHLNCDLAGFDGFDGRVDPFRFFLRDMATGVPLFVRQTLDNTLTNEQRALLGCGPFWGIRCDSAQPFSSNSLNPKVSGIYGAFGGLDFMNMEGSVLVQAWPGLEGTIDGHSTTAALSDIMQPGTVGFVGGPVCTRFSATAEGQSVKLPGCRGVASLDIAFGVNGDPNAVIVEFEAGYLPSVDGCVIGSQIRRASGQIVPVAATYGDGASAADNQLLGRELALCNTARTRVPVPEFEFNGFMPSAFPDLEPNGTPDQDSVRSARCMGQTSGGTWGGIPNPADPFNDLVDLQPGYDHSLCQAEEVTLEELPLIHPLAGCIESDVWYEGGGGKATGASPNSPGGCEFYYARDLVSEFFDGTAALFQNELAAFSWNFLMLLTVTSCSNTAFDLDGFNHDGEPDFENPYSPGRCSYATPQFCTNVRGFLSAAGVRRNVVRAGGEIGNRFGRRTFAWHGGGEAVLTYEKRNVLGFSTDFGEDVTKTNWGLEFTWIEDLPFSDNNSLNGITRSDAYNLTISVDRPTFINFLNPNRTFFFNSQWFFGYRPSAGRGFTRPNKWNALFTFAMFTGYYQDRVNPQLVTVYDFNSQSGGVLPSFQYRFTESFSVTIGMLYFFGRTELQRMPVNELGPPANRVGKDAYRVGVDNALSLIRKRDEVFMRVRWTF
jgi:hypothetical protein